MIYNKQKTTKLTKFADPLVGARNLLLKFYNLYSIFCYTKKLRNYCLLAGPVEIPQNKKKPRGAIEARKNDLHQIKHCSTLSKLPSANFTYYQ